MASTGIERQSAVGERLAILTARSKHIDGEGYGTTRADPMLIAGAMAGLSPLQRELMHAKYMLDARAYQSLVKVYSVTIARQYDLPLVRAVAVSRAAVHCVVNGVGCKECTGTGVTAEQKDCPKCEGVGMRIVSDRQRAIIAGMDRETFRTKYADIADSAETELRRAEASALARLRESLRDGAV